MQYIAHVMPVPSDIAPIPRRSAREAVFERLQSWIEEGLLAPGEVIKDAELAQQLGVSRTPVREALQMLEQHGLVEMQPGRLTRVTDTAPEDIALVYAPLSALQALAAELATPQTNPADLDEMRAHNARLLAAVEANDAVAAREADRAFHDVLLRRVGNPYLSSAIEPMLTHIRRLEALYFTELEPGHRSYEEHQRIIDAVAAGDAEAARETTRANFHRFVGAER
jgi:DNA-binding GntR family transcriptional regulator